MTDIQKLIKQVFNDYEYGDEDFIITPHIENLEKILLRKVAEIRENPVENRVRQGAVQPGAVAVDYRLLKELKPRAETGLMKFGDDWMGVFIRGDNALAFAYDLRELLENEINPLRKIRLEYYLELLLSVKQ